MQDRTKIGTNHRILVCCLFLFSLLGITYYIIDDRKDVYEPAWVLGMFSWYIALCVTIVMVFRKTTNGYLMAGIFSWFTLAFWLADNWYVVFHTSIIAAKPNFPMTVRNFIGAAIAALAVLSSHNSFHKTAKIQGKK